MLNKWTQQELLFLKEHYPDDSWDNILLYIKRSKDDIVHKASDLGIKRNSKNKKIEWTNDEIETLRSVYLYYKIIDIKNIFFPNKSKDSIIKMMGKLRLLKSRPWTDADIKELIELYPYYDNEELCKKLDRTRNALVNQAKKLGVKKNFYFTNEDLSFIRENYETMSDFDIGHKLGHPYRVIKEKRLSMGLLRKTPIAGSGYYDLSCFLRDNSREWKISSSNFCNNECAITGEKSYEIHHLYGMNMIVEEVVEELGLEKNVSPKDYDKAQLSIILKLFLQKQEKHGHGVCLRKDIHILFHQEYGYGDNTPEQFIEFVKKHNFILQDKFCQYLNIVK